MSRVVGQTKHPRGKLPAVQRSIEAPLGGASGGLGPHVVLRVTAASAGKAMSALGLSNRSLSRCVAAILFAFGAVCGLGRADAQQFGSVRGRVADERGESLPGVSVTLEGVGAPKVTVTDDHGAYRFLALDPGTYSLRAALDGYSTVEQPRVGVRLNRATMIDFTLSSAIQEAITVTSETPLLDESRLSEGKVLGLKELETLPSTRDPWSFLNQVPGVLLDRINVGGSETGDQLWARAPGVDNTANDYLLDGAQITYASPVGATPLESGLEQYESFEISTGGADVTKNTAGVAVNLVTRRGTNEFRGSATFQAARGDGLGFLDQSSSDFDCNDLASNQDCEDFEAAKIRRVDEYGFQAGGPAITDHLWLFGFYTVREIDRVRFGGADYKHLYQDMGVRLNAQLSAQNSAVASWTNYDKIFDGRGAGPTRPSETTWDQRGPAAFWRLEDTHVFTPSLYLTGAYVKRDVGFTLNTKASIEAGSWEAAPEALLDSDGIFRQNFLAGVSREPGQEIKLDGSYFFNTGDTSHELKFGGRQREAQPASVFAWPGRNILHYAGENFGNAGIPDFFHLERNPGLQDIPIEYASLWVQDTIAAGAWTINLGLRYDHQEGTIGAVETNAVPPEFADVLPRLSLPAQDPGFDWSTVTPRIGATLALGEERDTLLRASASQFAQALGSSDIKFLSGATYSYAYYAFVDQNDNDQWDDAGEPYFLLFTEGFNPEDPLAVVNAVDPGLDPEMTTEVVLGVEHSFQPELVVGATLTWRSIDDVHDREDFITGPGITDPLGRPWTAADFVSDGVLTQELPTVIADGSVRSVETFTLAPGFQRTGGEYLRNGDRSREFTGLALNINKRLSNGWALRGYVNWGETEWDVPASYLASSDPNSALDGTDRDGAVYLVVTNPTGRGPIYLQSSWQASLTGIYQVAQDRPWGFTVSGNIYAREGYPVPYGVRSFGSTDGVNRVHSVLGRNVNEFRSDDVLTVDLHAEKLFAANHNVNLNVIVELFNVLNEATVLSRDPVLTGGTADWVQDVIAPRIWKLGVRVSWR